MYKFKSELDKCLKKHIGKTCNLNDTWFYSPCKGIIERVDYQKNTHHYPLRCTKGHYFCTSAWLELMGGHSVIEEQCKIYDENVKLCERLNEEDYIYWKKHVEPIIKERKQRENLERNT